MNGDSIKSNVYGVSTVLKIIILVISVFSISMVIYLLVRAVFEIDTFGEQKYLLIIPTLILFVNVYCICTLKCKIMYYNKTITLKLVILSKTIDLNKYKYFKIDHTIPISYLLYTDDKSKKIRIHYFYAKGELFYKYLLNNLEEIK